jgi:phosphatidylglycerol---prolipoprotein diacylglyceryl transferase
MTLIFTSQMFYIVLAPLITAFCSAWFAGKQQLDRKNMLLLGLACCFGAFWGGDLYVLFASGQYDVTRGMGQLFEILDGDKSIIGAFIGAAVTGLVITKVLKVNFLAYADAAVPAVALGCAVARMACFVNGDDFGVPTNVPWAVSFSEGTVAYYLHLERGWIEQGAVRSLLVHPTQLYHMITAGLGFVLLVRYRPIFAGENLAIGLAYYGMTRFAIQFYRDDHYYINNTMLDTTQWFCLMFMVSGLALWVYLRRNDSTLIPVVWSKRS